MVLTHNQCITTNELFDVPLFTLRLRNLLSIFALLHISVRSALTQSSTATGGQTLSDALSFVEETHLTRFSLSRFTRSTLTVCHPSTNTRFHLKNC